MKKGNNHLIPKDSNQKIPFNISQLQFTFEFAAVGMALTSLDGRLFKVNPVFCDMVGYSEAELLSMTIQDITHPEENEIFQYSIKRLLSGQTNTVQMEKRYIHRSKGIVWVLLSIGIFSNQQQEMPYYIIYQIQDISELKKKEEALRQSEERYRLLIENAPLCIHEIDMEGHLRSMNRAGLKMMGIDSESKVCGLKYLDVVDREDFDRVRSLLERAYSGTPSLFEYRAISIRGTRYFDSCFIPIKDRNNKVFKLMGVTQDITERKEAEEKRLKLERQMLHKQKLESLGLLAGGIAHDFNNVLTSILGYSDLAMKEVSENSTAKNYLDEVVNGAHQAVGLIQQLLSYSGKGNFSSEPIQISDIVHEMSRLLEISISKKCVLKYELSSNLPIIEGDKAQVRQIIMNLIINASEAIGEKNGQIHVSTGSMWCNREYLLNSFFGKELSEGFYIFLRVSDTGEGIAEENKVKIFDPFFTTKQAGHGLGLSVVLGIVRGHQGTLTLKSEKGKGTTFEILFPITEHPPLTDSKDKESIENWMGNGMVLIVDDEPSIRKLAEVMLKKLGFTIMTAKDGKDALDLFHRHSERISLILLDMNMPNLNGEETFHEIRLHKRNVKVVLSSGYNEQTATGRLMKEGLVEFIKKPYSFNELRKTIKKIMEQSQ